VFQALLDDYLALAKIEESGQEFGGWGTVVNPLTGGSPTVTPTTTMSKASAATVIAKFVNLYLHL
jgi:hypothetical protein